jgi:hypothetical protein
MNESELQATFTALTRWFFKTGCLGMIAISVFAALAGLIIVGVLEASGPTASTQAKALPVLPLEKMAARTCKELDAATNPLHEAQIADAWSGWLAKTPLERVTGIVKRLRTSADGKHAFITIAVHDVEFSNAVPIEKGSTLYETASAFTENQCVIFSAHLIHSKWQSTRARVCSTEYEALIDFRPCT